MFYLDHSRLNFDLITDFGGVRLFRIEKSTKLDMTISTLPLLDALEYVNIKTSTGLREMFQSPIDPADSLKVNGLKELEVSDCLLDANSMGNLLEWILPSSRSTLNDLYLGGNEIETIPSSQLNSFPALYTIDISRNRVAMTIGSGSFVVSPINYQTYGLYLASSQVVRVEPGAFKGNYTFSYVDMSRNSLTRFEEDVFKAMVQDMSVPNSENYGFANFESNPFDCYSDSCHLAWLLRDNRQLLNSFLARTPPNCADGTLFKDLSPSLFVDCP